MSGFIADVYVTGANPPPGRLVPVIGAPPNAPKVPDNGIGINVYIAGGAGPNGAIPVSQTNPTQISLSGVSLSGVLTVTSSYQDPVWVTGSVLVLNPSSGSGGGGNVNVTASIVLPIKGELPTGGDTTGTNPVLVAGAWNGQVQPIQLEFGNAVAVTLKQGSSAATIGGVGTQQAGSNNAILAAIARYTQVMPTFSYDDHVQWLQVDQHGRLIVTQGDAPLGVTGTVAVSSLPGPLGVTGTVQVSGTASVQVVNLPTTQSVSVANPVTATVTNFPVQTTGVYVQNWPSTQQVAISGILPVNGKLPVDAVMNFSGTVSPTPPEAFPNSLENLRYTRKLQRFDLTSDSTNYVGYAVTGSADSDPVWTISRLSYDASGNLSSIQWSSTASLWSNRASEVYN